jgi:predicted RNA-binding protein (virulence factor B family)
MTGRTVGVTGRVARTPKPGALGLFVDLGREPEGFVDVLHLPREPDEWPRAGTDTTFEVLQHGPGQVRLFLLDDQSWSPDRLPGVPTQEQ